MFVTYGFGIGSVRGGVGTLRCGEYRLGSVCIRGRCAGNGTSLVYGPGKVPGGTHCRCSGCGGMLLLMGAAKQWIATRCRWSKHANELFTCCVRLRCGGIWLQEQGLKL